MKYNKEIKALDLNLQGNRWNENLPHKNCSKQTGQRVRSKDLVKALRFLSQTRKKGYHLYPRRFMFTPSFLIPINGYQHKYFNHGCPTLHFLVNDGGNWSYLRRFHTKNEMIKNTLLRVCKVSRGGSLSVSSYFTSYELFFHLVASTIGIIQNWIVLLIFKIMTNFNWHW